MQPVEAKVLITNVDGDSKKVLRIVPPFPQGGPSLTAWLLHQFDRSGGITTVTHELLVLDSEQKVVGPLLNGSQLYNGRRLELRPLKPTTSSRVGQEPPPPRPMTEMPVVKIPRFENNNSLPLPQFQDPTKSSSSGVPPGFSNFHMQPAAPTAVMPAPHSSWMVTDHSNPMASTFQQPQAHHPLPPPPLPPLPTSAHFNNISATSEENNNMQTSKKPLDTAIRSLPRDNLIDAAALSQGFKSLSGPRGAADAHFEILGNQVKRKLFRTLIRIILGAGFVQVKHSQSHTLEKDVLVLLRTKMSSSGFRDVDPKAVVRAAWTRGIVVSGQPNQETAGNGSTKNEKPHLAIGPSFEQESLHFVKEMTELRALEYVLDIIASANTRTLLRGEVGFTANGQQLQISSFHAAEMSKEINKDGSFFVKSVNAVLKKNTQQNGSFILSESVTATALESARCILNLVATKSDGGASMTVKEVVAHEKDTCNYLTKCIIAWCVARKLLSQSQDSVLTLSPWARTPTLREALLDTPTTVDFRTVHAKSGTTACLMMSTLHDHRCALMSNEGLALQELFNSCEAISLLVPAGAFASVLFYWAVCRLVEHKILELRHGDDVWQMCEGIHLDLTAIRVFASSVMRSPNNLLCHLPASQLLPPFLIHNDLPSCTLLTPGALLRGAPTDAEGSPLSIKRLHAGLALGYALYTKMSTSVDEASPPSSVVSLGWLASETKWAYALFGQKSFAVTKPLMVITFSFVQEAGLVTWDRTAMGFTVTKGLFHAMYLTFLQRILYRVQKKNHKKCAISILHDAVTKVEQLQETPVSIPSAKFSDNCIESFLDLAEVDRMVIQSGKGKEKRVTIVRERLVIVVMRLASDPDVKALCSEAAMCRSNIESDNTSQLPGGDRSMMKNWMLVPCGVVAPETPVGAALDFDLAEVQVPSSI